MSEATSETPEPRRWKPLDARQRRVLGVLIEKGKTTPGGYPMTVNAIVTGCNQKNNRDPLTAYDDTDVENALGELGVYGVVQEMDWLGRVPKYRHAAYEWLGVNRVELAVMGELLLRGAQAMGELRTRAARMEPIADLAALKPVVDGLVARGLLLELTPPGRGQVVSHNLYLAAERAEVENRAAGFVASAPPAFIPGAAPVGDDPELASEVARLRSEVEELRERIRALEEQLAAGQE